jgi:hypothetical protein
MLTMFLGGRLRRLQPPRLTFAFEAALLGVISELDDLLPRAFGAEIKITYDKRCKVLRNKALW